MLWTHEQQGPTGESTLPVNFFHEGHAPSVLVITAKGTGQVLELSESTLSFGCLYPHHYGKELEIDLLTASGTHISRLRVRKLWELSGNAVNSSQFELEVGAVFIDLSLNQTRLLRKLLREACRTAC